MCACAASHARTLGAPPPTNADSPLSKEGRAPERQAARAGCVGACGLRRRACGERSGRGARVSEPVP
eukprot:1313155-Prymnesium_polylepis.1